MNSSNLTAQVYGGGGGILDGIREAAGIAGIGNADPQTFIETILNILLFYVVPAAVIVIVIAGFYLILGLGSDDSRTKARKIIVNVIIGILIIFAAEIIVNLFWGIAGGSADTQPLKDFIQFILDSIISYAAILAVATIVIAGFYLILGLGSDDSRTKARNIVLYTVLGIILIGLAYAIVAFAGSLVAESEIIDIEAAVSLREALKNLILTALSYVAIIAVTTIIIAGFYLILGLGSDDSRKTARNIIVYTIVGIIVMIFAAAIVNFAVDIALASGT